MVNPALLASIDSLDADELDELIEYVSTRRTGTIVVTDERRQVLESRRNNLDPASWVSDEEFDARLDSLTS